MTSSTSTDPIEVLLVGDQGSNHVRRWADALGARGLRIVPIDFGRRGRSMPVAAASMARALWRVRRLSRRRGTVTSVHFVRGGLTALALRGVHPIVLSVWGRDITKPRAGWWGRFNAGRQRALALHADAVTATSEFLAATARERLGVEATIVPFGIDVELFAPAAGASTERAAAAVEPAPLRIGFVKWLEPKYGPDVLIEALGLLARDVAFEATIAGDGPMRSALEARVRDLGLGKRVRLLGRVDHSAVPDILRSVDVFAMPSREEEWGVAAAEASATGLPVVATRVGGIPEIVVDGETGILVAPDDPRALAAALARLASEPDTRARMGIAGRARVIERFRWDTCVDRMVDVLTKAAQRA